MSVKVSKTIRIHTGILPALGCLTYDFDDDPFTDGEWNEGVRQMWDRGLVFNEYDWAVAKKHQAGKVLWWAELGIRDKAEAPCDCLDVVKKLDERFPELAGFIYWSDEDYFNIVGNQNAKKLMTDPRIITLLNAKDRLEAAANKSK